MAAKSQPKPKSVDHRKYYPKRNATRVAKVWLAKRTGMCWRCLVKKSVRAHLCDACWQRERVYQHTKYLRRKGAAK